ncbi:MAG: hypothetical protein HQK76_07155 [Desulfobacterales bacterium]|nr:hypothetical protein [Desulfobacterales bacterium]
MIKNNEVKEGSKSRNIDKAKEKLSEMNMNAEQKARYEKYLMNTAIERDIEKADMSFSCLRLKVLAN